MFSFDTTEEHLLRINVGGEIIRTTRATLTFFRDSNLAALFSGRWDRRLLLDATDAMFLDFNAECFRKILIYTGLCLKAQPGEEVSMPAVAKDLKPLLQRTCVPYTLTLQPYNPVTL
jgi:hypothetical protein